MTIFGKRIIPPSTPMISVQFPAGHRMVPAKVVTWKVYDNEANSTSAITRANHPLPLHGWEFSQNPDGEWVAFPERRKT